MTQTVREGLEALRVAMTGPVSRPPKERGLVSA